MSFIPRVLMMTSDTQRLTENLIYIYIPFQYLHFTEDARLREVERDDTLGCV